ncbi:MAG: hypothetical protein KAX05_03675, partial [Bacteroidales bacterium]|nr:hypothetical protein [Bacteroidales bacterium]
EGRGRWLILQTLFQVVGFSTFVFYLLSLLYVKNWLVLVQFKISRKKNIQSDLQVVANSNHTTR